MSEHKPNAVDDMTQHIVTSNGPRRASHHTSGRIYRAAVKPVVAAGIVIVLIGLGGWYWSAHRQDTILPPRIVDLSNVSDYSEMTKPQADYYLYQHTGLTVEYLQQKGVSSKRLKTFDIAYQAAQALFVAGDKMRALQAYAIAQDKKPVNDDYSFYMTYAAAALRSGDKTTWKQEMLRARAVLAKQPQPTEPTEDMTVAQIDRIIKATEAN